MSCPCHSGKSYAECCKPYHDGQLPPTCLALMRSRYAAYALGHPNYIIQTTHPKSPYFEKEQKKWQRAILEFCHSTKFIDLEIVAFGENWVHFKAYLFQKKDLVLEEKSLFEKVANKWLYMKALPLEGDN
jgi:SEC-C motif-containing protein